MVIKEYIKKHWMAIVFTIAILVSIIGAIIFVKSAINTAKLVQSKTDTIRELRYIKQPPVHIPQYIVKEVHDTIEKIIEIPKEYEVPIDDKELREKYTTLLNEHFIEKNYPDSIILKDSAGRKVGIVSIKDKVKANSLQPRNVSYQLSFPKETLTITNTIKEKSRRKLLIGVDATFSKENPFSSAGVSLLYQDRQNKIIKASIGQNFGSINNQYVGVGFYIPISLRKNK